MTTGNKCHCLERATWLIRALAPEADPQRPALRTWAACDTHLAEAAGFVRAGLEGVEHVLTLRAES